MNFCGEGEGMTNLSTFLGMRGSGVAAVDFNY